MKKIEQDNKHKISYKKSGKNINNKVRIPKLYFGYLSRILVTVIFFLILLFASFYCFNSSLSINKEKRITYKDKSNLDYKVYLKDNDFYESDYLGKDMSYIASLIDYIDLFFTYDFEIDSLIDIDFDYKIVAVLNINDVTSSSNYLSKEYTLLEKHSQSVKENTSYHIEENIKLDYDYYNRLANQFKSTYGVGTSSTLDVFLKIDRVVTSDLIANNELNNQNSMSIHIPLSQKAISINMNYDKIKDQDSIVENSSFKIKNIAMLVCGVLTFILSIILLCYIVKKIRVLFHNTSDYDKYIKHILKEYDRLIVVTETLPDLDKFQKFKLNNFNELLDARDNTKKPIMYYNVVNHVKSYFYIKDNTDVYLLCIKAIDMEKNNKE